MTHNSGSAFGFRLCGCKGDFGGLSDLCRIQVTNEVRHHDITSKEEREWSLDFSKPWLRGALLLWFQCILWKLRTFLRVLLFRLPTKKGK